MSVLFFAFFQEFATRMKKIQSLPPTAYPETRTVKFIHSEKATKFCEIFTLLLTTVHTVKSKVKISQNFVAFSEYMNFKSSVENMKQVGPIMK